MAMVKSKTIGVNMKLILGFILFISLSAFSLPDQRARLTAWNTFAVVGDAGVRTKTTEALRNILKANNLNQILMLGDNQYLPYESYEYIWDIWKQQGFQFPLVAIGNHNTGYDKEVKYFQLPGEYYAKEFNGALFVVLNSDNEKNYKEQIKWADQVLAQSTYKLNFVIYHHPSVSLTKNHKWEERLNFQMGMRSIIKKYATKITALMNGHDHAAGFYLLNNVPLILSGASFEEKSLSSPVIKDFGFNVTQGWGSKGGYWWSKLDYNSSTQEVWIHYYRFDNQSHESCSIRVSPKPLARARNCQ